MKRLLLSLVLLFIISSAFPQIRIDWQQCYGSMGRDYAACLIRKNNGYWVSGLAGEKNGMVLCDDYAGARGSWIIEIGNTGEIINDFCVTPKAVTNGLFMGIDSNLFVIGLERNELEKAQLCAKKIDTFGNTIWETMVGDKNKGFWVSPRGILTPGQGLIAATPTQWSGGDISNYYGMDDAWVVKLDSLGNLEWETTLGTEGFETPKSFTLASDGGCYVAMAGCPGYTGSIPICQIPSTDEYDGIFIKLDANGNLLWSHCYGGSKIESIKDVLELADGFLLVCYTESDDRDVEGAGYHLGYYNNLPYMGQTTDTWLIRTDADGNIIWSRCYGGTGDEFPTKAFQNEDGGFTVFGTTESIDGDAQSAQNLHWSWQEYVYSKLWVFRTDANGNLMWERAIGTKMSRDMYLDDVVKLSDTEYTILATAHPPAEGYEGDFSCTNWDNRLCGYDSYWVLHITDIFNYDDPTGIEEQPKVVPLQMNVHPNPATTWVAIDYTLPNGNAKAELSIFNAMGVKVKQVELDGNQGQKVLDLRGLADGVYTCTVLCGEYCHTEKIVITK